MVVAKVEEYEYLINNHSKKSRDTQNIMMVIMRRITLVVIVQKVWKTMMVTKTATMALRPLLKLRRIVKVLTTVIKRKQ